MAKPRGGTGNSANQEHASKAIFGRELGDLALIVRLWVCDKDAVQSSSRGTAHHLIDRLPAFCYKRVAYGTACLPGS